MVIAPRVHRVRAPNASFMTLDGTNTYLLDLGDGCALAIDPGPRSSAHLDAIVHEARSAGLAIVAIAVTHGHPDHAPGAEPLARQLGVPVYAHRDARFSHDRTLADGEAIAYGTRVVHAIEAPGHAREHLVFATDDDGALFAGDVVIGRGTVVVAPPGGDMRAYQATLAKLRDREPASRRLYAGHGEPLADPRATFDAYLAHRAAREATILASLAAAPATVPALVETIYADVARVLWPAAARQIDAHLLALEREGRLTSERLDRAPSAAERAILTPDLSHLASEADTELIRAELGFELAIDHVRRYALT